MFLISAQTGALYYTKADTDSLFAHKVSTTGGGSITGHLDVGTSYKYSRIRSHADFNGYTGYAELNAASSCVMYLNLETTRVNGGWVYFKINGESYMQLSGSDNKVNIYTYTTISGNLDVGPSQATTSIEAYVNHAGHQSNVEIEARWNSPCYIHFNTTNADGLLFLATKYVIYMCCGLNTYHIFLQTNHTCFR